MRIILIISLLLLPFVVNAATLDNSREVDTPATGIIYAFEFSIKGTSDPVYGTEPSCYKLKRGERVRISPTEWNCFENLASATKAAQAKADKFETNFLKHGYGAGQ